MAPPLASALRTNSQSNRKRSSIAVTFNEERNSTKHIRVNENHHPHRNRDDDDEEDVNAESYKHEVGTDSKFSLAHDQDVAIEPFHMRNEREDGTGYFDGDTYVFRRQQRDGEEEDAWADALNVEGDHNNNNNADNNDNNNRNSGMGAYKDGSKRVQGGEEEEKPRYLSQKQKIEICRSLVELLSSDTETVVRALRRHNQHLKLDGRRRKSAWKKKRESKMDDPMNQVDMSNGVPVISIGEQTAKAKISQLTELADALLVNGFHDIYDTTKMGIESYMKNIGGQVTSKQSTSYFGSEVSSNDTSTQDKEEMKKLDEHAIQWEYKGNEDGLIHGPYTTEQMMSWRSAGFFVGTQAVDIRISKRRESSPSNDEKVEVDDLMADLEDDDENEDKDDSNDENVWQRSDTVNFASFLT